MLPALHFRLVRIGVSLLALALPFVPSNYAQGVGGGVSPLSNAEIQNSLDRTMTLYVSVRERSGIPLSVGAIVRLSSTAGGQSLIAPVTDAATATFVNIRGGEYEVQVEAPGYEPASEHLSLMGVSVYTAYIYLSPVGSSSVSKTAPGIVITPDLQRELDKSFVALNQKKFDEARKHLEKAHKMAPSNPDVLYLMGLIDYTAKDFPAARKRFESVLASYPSHQRSLLMLGQIQLDASENKDACVTLQKAVDAGNVSWQAHYLLAVAYARTGQLEKARIESQRTAELNKDKKPVADMLRSKLLLMEGRNADAREALEEFLHQFPQDPAAAEAKKYLAKIDEAEKARLKPANESAPAESHAGSVDTDTAVKTTPAFERPWAPPDVDSAVPPVAPGVACSSIDILQATQKRILKQLSDLEKFGATEHIDHQWIDTYGVPTPAVSQNFDYLIFVHYSKELAYYFDELRNGAESLYNFPTSLATRGLVSLGFMIIHPVFSQDFQFTCEGLGTWNGRPAWQIHFAQRGKVPPRIRNWSYKGTIYPIPLKGRIWIAANSYNVLHLETSLREPVADLHLDREQLIVDYGPVRFRSGATELWLPWYAEMYFDLQGRRYHHRHTLTNYVLFNVDTSSKIKIPPTTEPPEN